MTHHQSKKPFAGDSLPKGGYVEPLPKTVETLQARLETLEEEKGLYEQELKKARDQQDEPNKDDIRDIEGQLSEVNREISSIRGELKAPQRKVEE